MCLSNIICILLISVSFEFSLVWVLSSENETVMVTIFCFTANGWMDGWMNDATRIASSYLIRIFRYVYFGGAAWGQTTTLFT